MGTRIRALRTERGWSQEGFADRCGLDRTYIGGIERGERNLAVLNLLRITRTLGVTVGELFGGISGGEADKAVAKVEGRKDP